MGDFIRGNRAKREKCWQGKKSSPLISNHPENFFMLCTQKHNQGRVLTNLRSICRKPLVSLLFHPSATKTQLAGAAPRRASCLGQPGCLLWTEHRYHQAGAAERKGSKFTPHLPVVRGRGTTLILLSERLQYTRHMCVPKDRKSQMSRWGTGFFPSFYSWPQNQHMI